MPYNNSLLKAAFQRGCRLFVKKTVWIKHCSKVKISSPLPQMRKPPRASGGKNRKSARSAEKQVKQRILLMALFAVVTGLFVFMFMPRTQFVDIAAPGGRRRAAR
jgi:hypothetical protein